MIVKRMTKNAHVSMAEGTKRVRPSYIWMDSVKETVEFTGISDEDTNVLTGDHLQPQDP